MVAAERIDCSPPSLRPPPARGGGVDHQSPLPLREGVGGGVKAGAAAFAAAAPDRAPYSAAIRGGSTIPAACTRSTESSVETPRSCMVTP